MKGPSSILIIHKTSDPNAYALALEIRDWLTERGVFCRLAENRCVGAAACGEGKEPDLALVLGGDGTMLSEARKANGVAAPLLGLNLGRVGFLTGFDPGNWRLFLTDILADGFETVERLMFDVRVLRGGEEVLATKAVNDVVISRGPVARLIEFDVDYGGERICRLRADGAVISTPTGSTAYCVSAGGPLIHPDLDVFCLTPVCPFPSDFKSLVLPSSRTMTVTVDDRSDIFLTADGQELFPLKQGDAIVVSRAPGGFVLVVPRGDSFFERLRRKGFVRDQ